MNKLKMIEKLGFRPYMIEDNELREECEIILNNVLSDYFIDNKITDYNFVNEDGWIDCSNILQLCRGFDKLNDSYDFICIKNKKNNIVNFIIRPTLQSKFNSDKFGESVKISYRMNDGVLEINKISKYNGDLLNEKHMYVRDSKDNDLVLISEYKMYYCDDVKYEEATLKKVKELRKIYDNGQYINNNLIPIFSELYLTSKANGFVKRLFINDLDTGLNITSGTSIYNIDKNVPEYITNYNSLDSNKSLIECFEENFKTYENRNNKNSMIKMLR